MRWACLLLPHLALDAILRQQRDPSEPLALIAGPFQRRILHAVNPAAHQAGLRRGMLLSVAQALGVDFHRFEYDPKAEAATRDMLATWAYGFTSQVSLQFPHALVLEIAGSRKLFGEWPELSRRLRDELTEMGFRHHLVAAPNPFAAWVLARSHRVLGIDDGQLGNALGQLPVERVGLPLDVAQTLSRSGLRRMRQVFSLPRESVARRFPKTVLQHLDAMRGDAAVPLTWFMPPDRFETRIEFEYEVESSQALLFPLRRLTADLATFLSSRDGGVLRFTLKFEHEQHPYSALVIGLLAPEREASILFELARSRLEKLQLPAGTRGMRLVAEELPAFIPVAKDLFDTRPQQAVPWEQLRERLRARLGDDAVQAVVLREDHRPERATQAIASSRKPTTCVPLPRPMWLLDKPIPLHGHGIQPLAGPERIESGWWDGSDVRRAYYVVRTGEGQTAWAFQPQGHDGLWLQGFFA